MGIFCYLPSGVYMAYMPNGSKTKAPSPKLTGSSHAGYVGCTDGTESWHDFTNSQGPPKTWAPPLPLSTMHHFSGTHPSTP